MSSFPFGSACLRPKARRHPRCQIGDETKKVGESDQFKKAMENIGDVVAFLDQAEFAKFWDEDAKRVEQAVSRSAK